MIYSVRYLVDDGLNGKNKICCVVTHRYYDTSNIYSIFTHDANKIRKQNTFIYYLAICSILFSVIFILNDKNIPILGSYIEKFIV